ncbi:hypothetical protein FDECE_1993 [Fusarium decemcellulare]|nr:hypothetical protein FDECE_1993 [Fusarium decemcellulare]
MGNIAFPFSSTDGLCPDLVMSKASQGVEEGAQSDGSHTLRAESPDQCGETGENAEGDHADTQGGDAVYRPSPAPRPEATGPAPDRQSYFRAIDPENLAKLGNFTPPFHPWSTSIPDGTQHSTNATRASNNSDGSSDLSAESDSVSGDSSTSSSGSSSEIEEISSDDGTSSSGSTSNSNAMSTDDAASSGLSARRSEAFNNLWDVFGQEARLLGARAARAHHDNLSQRLDDHGQRLTMLVESVDVRHTGVSAELLEVRDRLNAIDDEVKMSIGHYPRLQRGFSSRLALLEERVDEELANLKTVFAGRIDRLEQNINNRFTLLEESIDIRLAALEKRGVEPSNLQPESNNRSGKRKRWD